MPRRADPTGWPEWLARNVPVWLGMIALFVTLLFIAWLLVLFAAGPSLAQSQQIKIPQACAKLAALFGATVPEHFSRIEAEAALSHMNVRMILVPEARHCRAAIQKELKK